MNLLLRLVINALLVLAISIIVPGIQVDGVMAALIVAVVLALVNVTLKPLLIVLTLPITLVTFGLFIFVINALMLWFVGSILEGFEVAGFIPAFIGALLISVGHLIVNRIDN